jgi:hypothetical protein
MHLMGAESMTKTVYDALRGEYALPVLNFKPGLDGKEKFHIGH